MNDVFEIMVTAWSITQSDARRRMRAIGRELSSATILWRSLKTSTNRCVRSCLDSRIRRSETQDGLLSAGLVVILTHKNHH